MSYTKLFSSLVTSTIWLEDDKTRIVWITMLALADKNGEVMGSVPGLARIAGVPVDACRAALERFLSPDPDSRTKDDEGRRIEVIDGGWCLLNHRKYREMCSREEAKGAEAKRKARYRAKVARNSPPMPQNVPEMSQNVPDKSQAVPKTPHIAEAEAEAEAAEKRERETRVCSPASSPAREGTPTLARAIALADTQGVTAAEAEAWWNAREASEWTKSGGGESRIKVPLDKLAQDLKAYTNAVRESNRRRAPGGYQRPPQPAPDYAGDIRRIEAKKAAQAAMEAENRAFAAANPDLDTF